MTTSANVKLRNSGSRNDRYVKLEIVSAALGISETISDIDMDSTDEVTKRMDFTLSSKTKPGVYDVTVRTYNQRISLSDTRTVKIVVPDCNPVVPVVVVQPVVNDTKKDEPAVIIVAPEPSLNVTTDTKVEPAQASVDSNLYIAILIVLVVLLLGGIVGLIVYLLRPSK